MTVPYPAPPPAFVPESTEFQANPYPTFELLRRDAPIFFYPPWGKWILTRYRDIHRVLRDRSFGRTTGENGTSALPQELDDLPHFKRAQQSSLMELEPPNHTRIRRAVQGVFTPKLVRELEPTVVEHCHRLIDRLEEQPTRKANLLREFAEPIPVRVIANLLGVPENKRNNLPGWSKDIIALFEPHPSDAAKQRGELAARDFAECIEHCLEEKAARPQADLLSSMAALNRDSPEKLSRGEIVSNSILLLNAGHEAVVNVLGNGLFALLSHREQLNKLRQKPELVPTAIEEMMRFDTPVPLFDRFALEDTELHGQKLRKGDQLALFYGSANRDPEVFKEPERFDITRSPNPHIAFGLGLHFCLGAPLARVELGAALPVLLDRLPELELDTEHPPSYQPGNVFRYLADLRVRF